MKKLLLVPAFCLLALNFAEAQVLDIGQDIGKKASDIKKGKDDKPLDLLGNSDPEAAKADEKAKSGFFSFLNFSFGSDDEETEQETAPEDEGTKLSLEERLTRSADAGSLKSQKALAYAYLYGKNGITLNYEKAFKYYSMAAEQNDPIALNNLGSLYFNGIGVPQNYQKAINLFEKAAAVGNSEAALNLGFIYLSGRNASSNASSATTLFKQAANADSAIAKYMLGYSYFKGFGVEQNYNEAARLIKEAADADFDEAQFMMGYFYLYGIGITKNYANAEKYLTWSAVQGNLTAMMMLADAYANGDGIQKNPYTAYVMYNVASVMGESSAGEKRDAIEAKLKPEEIAQAQAESERFSPKISKLTEYSKQTFGENVRRYIDENTRKK